MKSNFFILLILSVFISHAQTTIPGGNVSGTWTLAGSPYNVMSSIVVPDGSTLTIEPGVTVNFQGTYKLLVLGRLLAIGTITDTIVFKAINVTTGWRGIRFDNTPVSNDTSKIMYCKLRNGIASGAPPDNSGGALFFSSYSRVIVSNSHILNGSADVSGGGIYCSYSNPILRYNKITNFTAPSGGGICCSNSSPSIIGNTIANCTANTGGGISCFTYSNPLISGNTINNNTAALTYGGGIIAYNSSPLITGNTISNNTAKEYSGGIHCTNNSAAIITKNIINNNSVTLYGAGGIYYSGDSPNVTITYNKICNNHAVTNGGGIMGWGTNNNISNNLIANNLADGNGGGIHLSYSTSLLTNNTIVNNSAQRGGGIYCENNSDPIFRNCILYGNSTNMTTGDQVYLYDEPTDPAFLYCDIANGLSDFDANGNFFTGSFLNNISSSPQFVNPAPGAGLGFDGLAADWSLMTTSPCINAGDPAGTYPLTDLAQNTRVINTVIDIGAYELQSSFGVNDLSKENQISIFPNPFSSSTTIHLDIPIQSVKLEICNTLGQVLKTFQAYSNNITIEREGLNNGLYSLRLIIGNKYISTTKLIITN
jgi:hypothetical protein